MKKSGRQVLNSPAKLPASHDHAVEEGEKYGGDNVDDNEMVLSMWHIL